MIFSGIFRGKTQIRLLLEMYVFQRQGSLVLLYLFLTAASTCTELNIATPFSKESLEL